MALSITLELSDSDLRHFRDALEKSAQNAAGKSDDDIIAGAREVLAQARSGAVPAFIADRLSQLEDLLAMLSDSAWALPDEDRQRVMSTLVYFADADDVIPDNVPVLGYLDDAIMIELCGENLAPEIEAYAEFCDYRQTQAKAHGIDPSEVGHADWLESKRQALQERMHQRRRDFGVGYGSSEGYAHKRGSYTNRSWRPPVDRIR
jgi:uncharacterized membrane protein YkvA (DUF1232 family)